MVYSTYQDQSLICSTNPGGKNEQEHCCCRLCGSDARHRRTGLCQRSDSSGLGQARRQAHGAGDRRQRAGALRRRRPQGGGRRQVRLHSGGNSGNQTPLRAGRPRHDAHRLVIHAEQSRYRATRITFERKKYAPPFLLSLDIFI